MLKVQNISFAYPRKQVLTGVDFEVQDHDIFAILGRNAAGKTTLISVMVGLLEKQGGQLTVDDEVVTGANSPRYFGIMRSLSDMYLKMTAYEYLSLVGTLYNVPGRELHKRILAFAKRFEFEEHLYKKLSSCSLGTKKKVSFCACIIHKPRYVILDEPFDSIDPIVCYEMKQYLTEYARTEGTVIVTSHALDLIQNFCNRYIIIHDGTVAAAGTMQDNDERLEKIFIDVVGSNDQD
ncbi:MAG: ABC transporter ATP-binding protein [Ruminococcaceae bacterium]|nr:ABC transporter ATP-binding protein [Oscillospiraceae bacterium]